MKNSKKYLILLVTVLCFILTFSISSIVFAATTDANSADSMTLLVNKYVDAINNNDVDAYIALFTQDNQNEMTSYIKAYGKDDFFQENNVELTNITKLSDQVGKDSSNITKDEISKYSDTTIYYTEMIVQVKNGNGNDDDDILDNGYVYKNFIIVKENGDWKISRVSSPDLAIITDKKEGVGTEHEKLKMEDQKTKTQLQISEDIEIVLDQAITSVVPNAVLAASPTSDPTSITVYFTKSANSNYYGVSYKLLDWTTYLKNVIPQEWIVSYYGSYPAYLQAGAMASKMYAWWYINHPKWNYAPYYSNVKDNSEDQNFLYNAYSSMSSTYRGYEDEVISLLNNFAMCRNDGVMFEVHYHATQGTQHSGTMSASGALSLAQSGNSMYDILSYYYSYSQYTGTDKYITLFYWV